MKIDQQRIREYLLDPQFPSVEEFEEQLFSDENLYLAVQEEQESLLEDFVSGQLSKEDVRRFQQQCNLSPVLQQRVNELRGLLGALQQNEPRTLPVSTTVRSHWWQTRVLVASLASVACMLLVWATFVLHRRGSDTVQVKPAVSVGEPIAQSSPAPIGPEQTFFLADGVTRGPSSVAHLKIAPESATIKLQLELRSSSALVSPWNIEVLHGTEEVWHADAVQPQHAGQEVFLIADIYAASIPDGPYIVRLKPLAPGHSTLSREFVIERTR
jgi:hypothetical protein